MPGGSIFKTVVVHKQNNRIEIKILFHFSNLGLIKE